MLDRERDEEMQWKWIFGPVVDVNSTVELAAFNRERWKGMLVAAKILQGPLS